MDKEVSDAISALNKRVEYQEMIHRNKTLTPEGVVSSVAINWFAIILAVSASTAITVAIIKFSKNKKV